MEKRKAFVLWISPSAAAADANRSATLEGQAEEVDTGRELRFRSVEQLVSFLKECIGPEGKDSD